jgi:hypothetical protein
MELRPDRDVSQIRAWCYSSLITPAAEKCQDHEWKRQADEPGGQPPAQVSDPFDAVSQHDSFLSGCWFELVRRQTHDDPNVEGRPVADFIMDCHTLGTREMQNKCRSQEAPLRILEETPGRQHAVSRIVERRGSCTGPISGYDGTDQTKRRATPLLCLHADR